MGPKKAKADAPSGDEPPAKMNRTHSDYDELDFSNESKTKDGSKWNFKISTWNVDGLRAWLKKDGLSFIKHEKPDVICFQEIKCSESKLPKELTDLEGYPNQYWCPAKKDGYSGVGILSKTKAKDVQYGIGSKEHDDEGRCITVDFGQFYLVATYVPNAGRKLVTLPKRMEWDGLFREFLTKLDAKKPVVLCGDMNVAHKEIDLKNPKTNKKTAGFTVEEREGFDKLLEIGFVDSFRHFHPKKENAYTYWTYMMNCRAKNVGWRLDYFVVSKRFMEHVTDNVIRDQVFGSDHCPCTLFIKK